MSVTSFTAVCDWPGCVRSQEFANYPGCERDWQWVARHELHGAGYPRHHLCPAHRHRTWTELDHALAPTDWYCPNPECGNMQSLPHRVDRLGCPGCGSEMEEGDESQLQSLRPTDREDGSAPPGTEPADPV